MNQDAKGSATVAAFTPAHGHSDTVSAAGMAQAAESVLTAIEGKQLTN